jgi:hypothetical protein
MNGDESVPPGVGRKSAEWAGRRPGRIAKIAKTAKIARLKFATLTKIAIAEGVQAEC